ncbi:MAG: methylated-DNA--[protein]-cysteine S-methyltransferase [Gammaproteobacteria bacterium]|nr:methylated-DNA--[protein]-cysteine S-methyltransferase [Gammaproteobacteria bacterium]
MSQGAVSRQKIWDAVKSIPRGRVASYGQVARMAGMPGRARLVGHALKQLPPGSDVPWHRVINASWKIAFPPGSPAWEEQHQRLLDEGVLLHGGRAPGGARLAEDYLDTLLWAPDEPA